MKKIRCFIFFLIFLPALIQAKLIIVGDLTHQKETIIGKTYQGTITIQNIGQESEEIKAYQTDYLFFSDGKVIYGDPGETPRSNASWISISPKQITIPAQGLASVNYIIKVPDDESLTGTYWSIIMIEPVPEGSPESSRNEENDINLGVRQIFRYGIQMVTHIGDTGTRNLSFIGSRLSKTNGKRMLELDIENTGERWLRAEVWCEIYDDKGYFSGKFEGSKLRIYPDTSVKFSIDLTSLIPAEYKALVIADCGENDMFGITFNLILKE